MDTADFAKAKGNEYMAKKNFGEAIKWYGKGIELDPTNYIMYSNRSAAYLSAGRATEALKDAEKCVELNSKWPKGYCRKGAALQAMRRYEEATDTFEKGLKNCGPNDMLQRGLDEVTPKRDAEYEREFVNELVKIALTHPDAAYLRTDPSFIKKVMWLQKNPHKFTTINKDPQISSVILTMVEEMTKRGVWWREDGPKPESKPEPKPTEKKELKPTEKELKPTEKEELKPTEEEELKPTEKELKPTEKEELKPTEEEELKPTEKEEPKPTEEEELKPEPKPELSEEEKQVLALREEGNALYKKKNFDAAMQKYKAILEIQPKNISVRNNMCAVLLEQGKYDECIEQCQESITLAREIHASFEDIAKTYMRLGNAEVKRGNYDAALEAFISSRTEFPLKGIEDKIKQVNRLKAEDEKRKYINPEEGLKAKERGNQFFLEGKYAEAIREYDDAIRRDPTNASYYNNRGTALSKLLDYGRAMADINKALELDPKYVKAWVRKGNIEMALKQYHRSIRSFKCGLEIDPMDPSCKEGVRKTRECVEEMQKYPIDPVQQQRSMDDPEILAIVREPEMNAVLQDIINNPKTSLRYLKDPVIADKLDILVYAGIIRLGNKSSLLMIGVKTLVSASVGFLIAIVVAICIEKCGGAIGGVISSVPTTIVPTSYVFLTEVGRTALEQAESLFAAPIGIIATNLVFLPVWKILPSHLEKRMKNGIVVFYTLVVSLVMWFVAAILVTWIHELTAKQGMQLWVFSLIVMAVCVVVGVVLCWRLPPTPKGTHKVHWYTHILRGLAAALCICISSLLSSSGLGLFAGAFSGFPAIFSTTMVSVSLAQGASVSTGAVGPMIIGGCAGGWYALLCGAIHIYTTWNAFVCIAVSYVVVVLVWNVPVYFFVKWRRDETNRKTLPATTFVPAVSVIPVHSTPQVEHKEEKPKDSMENDQLHGHLCVC